MTESNLSKSDLLEICSSLGLSTEGNKIDLIQRLKENLSVLDINPEGCTQTLRDLLQTEKCTTWGIPLDNLPRNVEKLPDCQSQVDRETKKRKSLAEEDISSSLEDKLLLGFEKLEYALLN
ncbi:35886_t:CDS:2 [Racocetra persica]|uniref:35886_t:CDS:1 n=1 Tax=Racocetra persica TaxID=160502 RepID=A0ACA9KZM0_9GLOM|nr:35886_t:CDS:2 [Racocetra persica]